MSQSTAHPSATRQSMEFGEIGEALGRVHRMLQARLPTEGPSGSVTREQWTLLVAVARAGDLGTSMGQLAQVRGMPRNAVSTLADRMVNAGMLERRGDDRDRRIVRLVLTSLGAAIYQEVARARREVMRCLLAQLTDEQIEGLHAALPALQALGEAGL